MSALFARQTFDTWAQEVAALESLAYYNTRGIEVRPQDAVWWTASFQADSMVGDTFCGPGYYEEGGVRVIVHAQPGNGDYDAVEALERIVRGLMAKIDPTGRMHWQNFEPVFDDSDGSADAHFRVGAWLNYRLNL